MRDLGRDDEPIFAASASAGASRPAERRAVSGTQPSSEHSRNGASTLALEELSVPPRQRRVFMTKWIVGMATLFVCSLASTAVAQQNVVWTNVTSTATVTGNSIQKTSGCEGCQDAGGVSQQQISSGTGYVQFSVLLQGTQLLYVGLGNNLSTPPQNTQLNYAFACQNSQCDIRELGIYRTSTGTFASGDVFKIAIEAGPVVKYYRNGSLLYTSTVTPTPSLKSHAT
jgi:hypothetical protein